MTQPPHDFSDVDPSVAKNDDDDRQVLMQRMGEAVGSMPDNPHNADAFVGFFQAFRPDGSGLTGVFDCLSCGRELHDRLEDLFRVAGNDRRPQGGKDAYFVVRNPAIISPRQTEVAGQTWLSQLTRLAEKLGHDDAALSLSRVTRVRILEGIPPKHPRIEEEKTDLLKLLQHDIPTWLQDAVPENGVAATLRQPYYFIHCDPMLRDYLTWPLYRAAITLEDPLEAYFELWSHGVKWRVFQETQLDLYLPRQPN